MTDLSKIAPLQPYTAKQIVSFNLRAADFEQLGTSLTEDGTRVVIYHQSTGEHLSVPLSVDDGDQLYCDIARALPAERCTKHWPYQRGRNRTYDGFSPCRCAAVFLNHLLHCLATARANKDNQRLTASVR